MTNELHEEKNEIHGIDISGIVRCIELHGEEYPLGTELFSNAETQLMALIDYIDRVHVEGYKLCCEHGISECSDDGVVFLTYDEAKEAQERTR